MAVLDDDTRCYRHGDRTAAVLCQRCERPICPSCMNQASVGFHCPECARTGAQKVIPARTLMNRQSAPVSVALIAISVVAFLGQNAVVGDLTLEQWGLLFGPRVADGEWWRIITSGFLHGNAIHLALNMYALWNFGPVLERALGAVRFGLTYLAGLLGGSLAVLVFDFNQGTLGASGAVLGLAGALAAVLWSQGVKPHQTPLAGIFAVNLLLPVLMPFISFWGHLGGIAGGFTAGWLLAWLPSRYRQPTSTALGATAALCLALFALAVARSLGGT
jgi:membrane associated rhomboid family serine protease